MNQNLLTDPQIFPDDELINGLLGDVELLWKQTFSYLYDTNKDIDVHWTYSACGKYWVCQALKKKKSLFRVFLYRKNAFHVAFPIGDQMEQKIMDSNLPQTVKDSYSSAIRYNTTRYIAIDVEHAADLDIIKNLIDIKTGK